MPHTVRRPPVAGTLCRGVHGPVPFVAVDAEEGTIAIVAVTSRGKVLDWKSTKDPADLDDLTAKLYGLLDLLDPTVSAAA